MSKNISTYKGKPRKIRSQYLSIYQQKMRDQNYETWNKIKNEYLKSDNLENNYLRTDYHYNYNPDNYHIIRNNFNHTQKNFNIRNTKKKFFII